MLHASPFVDRRYCELSVGFLQRLLWMTLWCHGISITRPFESGCHDMKSSKWFSGHALMIYGEFVACGEYEGLWLYFTECFVPKID